MLNDSLVMSAAESTAKRVLAELPQSSLEQQIDRMFQLCISRTPTDEERSLVARWVQSAEDQMRAAGDTDHHRKAFTLTSHAVFASSRFQYLE